MPAAFQRLLDSTQPPSIRVRLRLLDYTAAGSLSTICTFCCFAPFAGMILPGLHSCYLLPVLLYLSLFMGKSFAKAYIFYSTLAFIYGSNAIMTAMCNFLYAGA